VADDASRENEGDLIIAAEKLTPKALSFMLRHTSGVVCVALTDERAEGRELPLMVPENSESGGGGGGGGVGGGGGGGGGGCDRVLLRPWKCLMRARKTTT
jgi:hypothetical protein